MQDTDIIDKLVAIMTNPSDPQFVAETLKEFQITLQNERKEKAELTSRLQEKTLEAQSLMEEKSRIAKAYHDKWSTEVVSTQTKEQTDTPPTEDQIINELKIKMEEKLNG